MFKFAGGNHFRIGLTAWAVIIICLGMLSGCGTHLGLVKDNDDEAQRIIVRNPPKSIAILPFDNLTESDDIHEFVRTTFYSHLCAQPYEDMELHEVDRKLKRHNLMGYDVLTQKSARRLGRILGCDAVVVGKVTEYQRLYAGLYSQMAVGASIAVWDTRTGKRIWSDEHVTRQHEGGLPLALTDIAMIGIRSGMNLTESEKVRTVDELSRYLTSRVPIPDINGQEQSSKFVSLKRLTKTENQAADEPKSKISGRHLKKHSLKKLTKVNHPRYR
ncbi:MAG: DUF799 family lipoprotein [Deltaproteobacteria bacterium]|nr:DUF799 family lipoprotein [Deltaproteobacteria bacterium]